MHYANGREAKNGDRIMVVGTKESTWPKPAVGILCDAVAGNNTCNGTLAVDVQAHNGMPNLAECLHIDDVRAALGDIKAVKDSSIKAEETPAPAVSEATPADYIPAAG